MELLLTIIFSIILFFWLLVRVGPYILAWWLRKKFGDLARGQHYQQANGAEKEGETYVQNLNKQQKVVDKNVGEYVDYEETK